ncbi:hypothetical protein D3C84_902970 [compost metagenome]
MGLGFERKLRGGEHIPHHERAANVGIHPIAAVIRQLQLCAGKSPCLFGLKQMLTQFGRGGWVRYQLGHRLTGLQQLQLSAGQLPVVTDAGTTVEQPERQQGNQVAKKMVECPMT